MKADNKIFVWIISKNVSFIQATSYWEFSENRTNNVAPDEAFYVLPHLDLDFLQIQLFSFLAL